MTIRSEHKRRAAHDLTVLSESEAVGVAEVQNRLTALWRQASESLQEDRPDALALACLWNLVVFHSNPERKRGDSGGEAHRIQQLLEQVTTSVPARVIHLEEWRDEAARAPGQEVEAWVGTHCLHSGDTAHMVCCEQINVAGYGEQGHSHFPALVRALQVPDLPTALLWLDDVPRKGRVLGQLLRLSERLVADSQHTTAMESLLALNDLLQSAPARIVDLGWLRLNPLRNLVADFFDPPGRAEQLARMEAVRITTSREGRNNGLLVLGWLLSRCGYREATAVDLGGSDTAYRWRVPRGDGDAFTVDFAVQDGYGGLDGIFALELRAGGDTFSLHDVDPEHMAVRGPDRDLPRVALREADETGLVVEALGAGKAGTVFAEAVAMAALLAEGALWNR